MAKGRVELIGVEEMLGQVRAKLQAGSARLERVGLAKGGAVLQSAMQSHAPRSASPRRASGKTQGWRTGQHAADNIKVSRLFKKDGEKYILVGIQRNDKSRYFYLKFFEFGTSKMPAQPWQEPAFRESKQELIEIFADAFRGGLRE